MDERWGGDATGSEPSSGGDSWLSPRFASVEDTARLVLDVRPGERALLPEFGCRIHSLRSITTDTDRHVAAALIEESLERWVPWLGVDRVDVDEATDSELRIVLWHRGERRPLSITWYGGDVEIEGPYVPGGGEE